MLLLATLFLDHSAPLHQLGLGAVLTTGFERRYLVLYYCDGSGHNRVECIPARYIVGGSVVGLHRRRCMPIAVLLVGETSSPISACHMKLRDPHLVGLGAFAATGSRPDP